MSLLLLLSGLASSPPPPPPPDLSHGLLPIAKVEIAPGFGPLDDPVTWVDVTSYVERPLKRRYGRSTEFDDTEAGRASITFKRSILTAHPTLDLDTPVRVTATWAGITYPRFRGYIDALPPDWAKGNPTLRATVYDAQAFLQLLPLPQSVYAWEVAQDAPHAWWHLGERDGLVAVDSSGNSFDGYYGGDERYTGSLIAGSSDGAVEGNGGVGSGVSVPLTTAWITSLPFAVELWMQSTGDGTRLTVLYLQTGSSTATQFGVYINSGAPLNELLGLTGIGGDENVRSAQLVGGSLAYVDSGLLDGRVHQVVYKRTVTVHELYVDGQKITTLAQALMANIGKTEIAGSNYVPTNPVTVDEVSTYNTDLSAARIAAHYAAGSNPWDGDTTGQRVNRILDIAGWPAALRRIDPGTAILGPATLAGRPVWDYLVDVVHSEGIEARLFVDTDGAIVFHDADHDYITATSTSVQARFTEDRTGADYLAADLAFSYDKRYVYDQVTASGDPGSVTVGASAATREKRLTGLLRRTTAELRNLAERFYFRNHTPQLRVEQWAARPSKNTAMWPAILGLSLGHRVELLRDVLTIDQHLEEIEETITGADWVISFNGSPVDTTSYFTWGTSTWGGTDVWR